MLKRVTKVTSLLITAVSVVSMVPAMATDVKKVEGQEGTVYSANAQIGFYFIDAEINGEDEAIYYVKDGKYNKLENAEPGDEITDFVDGKYLEMASGDYYVDITTGERVKDVKENDNDDKASALRKNIKKDNDGRFKESTYTGNPVAKDDFTIFGPTGLWSQFLYELKTAKLTGDVNSSVYADTKGNYFDADYNLGRVGVVTTGCSITIGSDVVVLEDADITIKNTEDTYEIKGTVGGTKKTYELKAQVSKPDNQGESGDYLSRSVDLSIWIKEKGAVDSNYKNITDKVEFGSSNNYHSVDLSTKTGDCGVRVMQKLSKEVASDDIDGIKYPKTTSLYFATDKDGNAYANMIGYSDGYAWTPSYGEGKIKAQTINYKSQNGYNYLDVKDVDEVDVEYTDISDAWGTYAFSIGCGDLYCLSDGYVKKFDTKEEKFVKIYKVDGSMNKIKVALQNNVVVWNENDKVYSIVDIPLSFGGADTKTSTDSSNTNTTTPAAATASGWTKASDGTWSYVKADGTKATGWLKDGSVWYYLKTDGIMATGWINDKGVWYYLNESGAMLANTTVDGYSLGNDGAWIK